MKKKNDYLKIVYGLLTGGFLLTGCSNHHSTELEIAADTGKLTEEFTKNTIVKQSETENELEPKIVEADWSEYFDGLNGTIVIYDASVREYTLYNRDLALTRSSPCFTFKIISSLIALENEILDPTDSIRTWSGEAFWNEDWNKDIDFREAFQTSCVWYYRQIVDDIGKETMQKELNKLQYGNCDISDWEGRLNTDNQNRALTGFWIESSLMISPKEQVEVMERIFGDYSEKSQEELKQVMLASKQEETGVSIYGKTEMGKTDGIVVDAWFTGFAESPEGRLYFCVRLGRTDNRNVSSAVAKEIAIQLVTDYYKMIRVSKGLNFPCRLIFPILHHNLEKIISAMKMDLLTP